MDKPKNLPEVLKSFDEQFCKEGKVMTHYESDDQEDGMKIDLSYELKFFITSSFTSLLEQLRQKEEPLPAILWKDEHEENLVKQVKNSMIKKFNNSLDILIGEK